MEVQGNQEPAPKIIQDPGEVPLVLHSDVRAPLASLSFLRRSLAMAELAMIAYNDEAEAQRAARAIGFPEAQAVRQRRLASLSIPQRARRRPRLPRHRADRVERHSGRRQRRDVGRRHARQRPQRLQPRSGRSLADAGRTAARQSPTGLVLRALAGRQRWPRSAPTAAKHRRSPAIRRSCTRLARRASAASATFATPR